MPKVSLDVLPIAIPTLLGIKPVKISLDPSFKKRTKKECKRKNVRMGEKMKQ